MKRLFCVCLVFLGLSVLAGKGLASQPPTLEQLMAERSSTVWIDGQALGDLVLGAKARLTFLHVDSRLVSASRDDPGAPEWLLWHSQHFGSKNLRGKALFLLRLETFTPWELSPGKLFVGSYTVSSADILTIKEFTPTGELPSHFSGTLPFSVPKGIVKAGSEIVLGYGKESVKWKVPGK